MDLQIKSFFFLQVLSPNLLSHSGHEMRESMTTQIFTTLDLHTAVVVAAVVVVEEEVEVVAAAVVVVVFTEVRTVKGRRIVNVVTMHFLSFLVIFSMSSVLGKIFSGLFMI